MVNILARKQLNDSIKEEQSTEFYALYFSMASLLQDYPGVNVEEENNDSNNDPENLAPYKSSRIIWNICA